MIGVLLLNLGTPDAATAPAVRRYLRQFLSDPYVIDIPAWMRRILLETVILPLRTRRATAAYQKIWTPQGSPLRFHTQALSIALQAELGDGYRVCYAMRYGSPSIATAVQPLLSQSIDQILLIPLYPQYARSTSLSALQAATTLIRQQHPHLPITTLNSFYDHAAYLKTMAALIQQHLTQHKADALIFSYHSLPRRHLAAVCPRTIPCHHNCPPITDKNKACYRAQCYETSRRLAQQLKLNEQNYHIAFQSRLGKIPWITPYTDHVLHQLAQTGIRDVAIVCPSFVVDCLETLEEIDIRGQVQWKRLGGRTLSRVPCLNTHPRWVKALSQLIRDLCLVSHSSC